MPGNPVAVLRHTTRGDTGEYLGARLLLWCPGCFDAKGFGLHQVWVPGRDGFRASTCWDWNGDLERPTVTPSLLCTGVLTCHSFITDGAWHYLGDCTHDLRGQVVPLPPLPEWVVNP